MKRTTSLASLLIILAICATPRAFAADALYDEISRLDTAMFEAFNAHDIDKIGAYFDDGLEFYHDKGGLSGKRESIAGITGMFDQNNGMHRDLVPGTLEVYPIKGYGAVEIGAHRFCHKENGKDDCGVFKFVQIWQKQGSGWKITRVVSYDH